jgi:hypothetical protein
MLPQSQTAIEEPVTVIFVDGQRCEVFVHTEADLDGTWHNLLLFRRGGRVQARDFIATGLDWHVTPDLALLHAQRLTEAELRVLLDRAMRTRRPLA